MLEKGSVFKDAIEKASNSSIKFVRCDIYSGLDGFITTMFRNKMVVSSQMGRKKKLDLVFLLYQEDIWV